MFFVLNSKFFKIYFYKIYSNYNLILDLSQMFAIF